MAKINSKKESNPRIYYWDSGVFTAYFMREEEYREGINEIISEIELGECKIITSVVTKTEILIRGYEPDRWEKIQNFLLRPEIEYFIVTHEIAELAAKIRKKLLRRKEPKNLPACDSIHLATAIDQKAFRLHTTDGDHLLKLQGKLPGYQIEICRPKGLQGNLFSYEPEQDN